MLSGKEFNAKFGGQSLLKFLPESMKTHDFTWKLGLNEDIHIFNPNECVPDGLHFCLEKHASEWQTMGTRVFRVQVPDDAEVVVFATKIKASAVILVEEFKPSESNLIDAWVKYKEFSGVKLSDTERYWIFIAKRSPGYKPVAIDASRKASNIVVDLNISIYELLKSCNYIVSDIPPTEMTIEEVGQLENQLGTVRFLELAANRPFVLDKFIQLKLRCGLNFFAQEENECINKFYTFEIDRDAIYEVFDQNVDRYIDMGYGHHIFFGGNYSSAWEFITRERGLKVLTQRVPDWRDFQYEKFVDSSVKLFTMDDWKLILPHYPGLIYVLKDKLTYELVELVSKAPADEFKFLKYCEMSAIRFQLEREFERYGFKLPEEKTY